MGIGFKSKLSGNLAYSLETKFRYTFKDDLDGYPYDPLSENIQINPNNNDWYVFTGITLVFGFGREGCYTGSF